MGLGRKRVLLLARDAVFRGYHLRAHTHVEAPVCLPKSVLNHRIDQCPVAQAIAGTRLRQQVRRIGHRLHAACHHDFSVPCLNSLCGQSHGLQSRSAHLIDGECAGMRREPSVNCSLAGRILPQSGLKDAAHDALVDELRELRLGSGASDGAVVRRLETIQAGTPHGLADRKCAQLGAGKQLQRSLEFADRCAHG